MIDTDVVSVMRLRVSMQGSDFESDDDDDDDDDDDSDNESSSCEWETEDEELVAAASVSTTSEVYYPTSGAPGCSCQAFETLVAASASPTRLVIPQHPAFWGSSLLQWKRYELFKKNVFLFHNNKVKHIFIKELLALFYFY